MKFFYFLLFLFTAEITPIASEKTAQTKSELQRQKKQLEEKIQYLQDRMLYQEANAEEPAELYGYLRKLKQVNAKINKLSRQ